MRLLFLQFFIFGAFYSVAEGLYSSSDCELNLRGRNVSAVVELALKNRYVTASQVQDWLHRGGQGHPWKRLNMASVEMRLRQALDSERARGDWSRVFPRVNAQLSQILQKRYDWEKMSLNAQTKTQTVKPVAQLSVDSGEIHSPLWFRRPDGWTLVFGTQNPRSESVQSSSSTFHGILKDVHVPGALQALRLSASESVVTEYDSSNRIEVSRVVDGEPVDSRTLRTSVFHVPMALGQTAQGRLLSARIADNAKTGGLMIVADITEPEHPRQKFIPLGALKVRGVKFVNNAEGQTYLFSPERVYRYVETTDESVELVSVSAPEFEQLPFEVTDIKVQVLPDNSFVVARQGRQHLVVDRVWPDGRSENLLSEEAALGTMSMHRDGTGRVFLAHAGQDQLRIFEPLVRPIPIMEIQREKPVQKKPAGAANGEFWHKAKWVNLPDGEAVFTASSDTEPDVRIYTPDVLHPVFRLPYALSGAPSWNLTGDQHLYLAVPQEKGRLLIFDLWYQLAQ